MFDFPEDSWHSYALPIAGVAQLVERLICNQQVAGSTPVAGSISFKEIPCEAWFYFSQDFYVTS